MKFKLKDIFFISVFIIFYSCSNSKSDNTLMWLGLAWASQPTTEQATVEVKGVIGDSNGDVITDASLTVEDSTSSSIQSRTAITSSTTTDSDGKFTLYLTVGKYTITVSKDGTEGSFVLDIQDLVSKHLKPTDITTYSVVITQATVIDDNTNLLIEFLSTSSFTKLTGISGADTCPFDCDGSTDNFGNIYVTGSTNGGLDGNTLLGAYDFFLIKYTSDGTKQWTKQMGVSGATTNSYGVEADKFGYIYLLGSTTGNLDGMTLVGTTDMVLIKFDSSGNKQWIQNLGVSGSYTIGFGMTIDNSNNIYVTGYTSGGLDGNTFSGAPQYDMFVTKYNSKGTKQWTKQLGTSSALLYGTQGNDITTDDSNNVYITGNTDGDLDGNTISGTGFNTIDMFVTRYDTDGNKQWTRQMGAGSGKGSPGRGIVANDSGDIFITGNTTGGLDGNTFSGGVSDMYLVKYDTDGNKQWTKQVGDTSSSSGTFGYGIDMDGLGNVYVIGHTDVVLNSANITVNGRTPFYSKYNANGDLKYTKQKENTSSSAATGHNIVVNGDGSSVIGCGNTQTSLDGVSLNGNYDAFITTIWE